MENRSKETPALRKAWTREPLIWFLVIGAILYGVFSMVQHVRRPKAEVTAEWLQALSNDFERRNGHALDKEERARLVRQQLEEEILYLEALKRGRAEDPRVRGLLAAILREELEPAIADPTDAQLEEYRKSHPDAYRFPEQVSFEHVSFTKKEDVPVGLLTRLQGGEVMKGDSTVRLANPLPLTWRPQLVALFGEDFAAALDLCKPGEWAGPLVSKRGVHFVKVKERSEPRDMSLEEVKPALASQWLKDQKAEAVSTKVAEWRRGYRVVLPEGISAP